MISMFRFWGSEIPSRELHATFAGLHLLRSITPDQIRCIVTDGVRDPISNKLCREAHHLQLQHRC